jgi:hypothetical protein
MQRISRFSVVAVTLLTGTIADTAQAQLSTQHLKGVVGLKSGTQPPPHVYFIAPLVYLYRTDDVKNADGDRLPIDADITIGAVAGGVNVVTTARLFGGTYGFQLLFPVGVNNRLQGTEIDANPGGGLSDSFLAPIILGWHLKRADVLASYGIFMPTGRYADGARDNTGFGMWGHEVAVGTTVYLNEARQYHAATLASFDFQTTKEGSETRVGNTMILEGGVGADFLHGGLTTGLAYYSAFKLSDDRLEGFADQLVRGKNKVFALGPEVSMALAWNGMVYGVVKANYQWELYARTATQGRTFTLLATFLVKPIRVPEP